MQFPLKKISALFGPLLLLGLGFLAPLYILALFKANQQLSMARAHVRDGTFNEAVQSYRRAVSWAAPANESARNAATELYELSQNSSYDQALRSSMLWELRAGIYSSRSFFDRLNLVDWRNDLLAKVDRDLQPFLATRPARLSLGPEPQLSYGFQFIAQFGFWAWILAVWFMIWAGFQADGSVRPRAMLRGAGLALLAYLIWLYGLSQA